MPDTRSFSCTTFYCTIKNDQEKNENDEVDTRYKNLVCCQTFCEKQHQNSNNGDREDDAFVLCIVCRL